VKGFEVGVKLKKEDPCIYGNTRQAPCEPEERRLGGK
jgi:hypothetical protein